MSEANEERENAGYGGSSGRSSSVGWVSWQSDFARARKAGDVTIVRGR